MYLQNNNKRIYNTIIWRISRALTLDLYGPRSVASIFIKHLILKIIKKIQIKLNEKNQKERPKKILKMVVNITSYYIYKTFHRIIT